MHLERRKEISHRQLLIVNEPNYPQPASITRNRPQLVIEIGTFQNKNFHNEYCFFLKDNGIGIEEKYLEKIFNPFQRATTLLVIGD
jgi:signal transduction histidine kinase